MGTERVIKASNAEIAAQLEAGKTTAELAEKYGVQPQSIRRVARLAGWGPGRAASTRVLPWRGIGPAAHSPAARGLRAQLRIEAVAEEQGISRDEAAEQELSGRNLITYRNWKAERDATDTVVMFDRDLGPSSDNPASPEHGLLYYAKRREDTPKDQYYQL
jgi:hypothetical protein